MKKSLILKVLLFAASSIFAIAATAMNQAPVYGTPIVVEAAQIHNSFSFTVNTITGFGDRIYYNPDVVQEETQHILKQMGATDVQVDVLGVPDQPILDPSVYVSFDSLRLSAKLLKGEMKSAVWNSVVLQGDDGVLAQGIFKNIASRFDIADLHVSNRPGLGPDYSYRDTFKTLFAR